MEGSSTDLISSLLPLVALFAIFYFLIIRPQQKQAKAHKEMVANLKKGDKILISEGCTHHRQCGDIGTVKLPNLIRRYTGKVRRGADPPARPERPAGSAGRLRLRTDDDRARTCARAGHDTRPGRRARARGHRAGRRARPRAPDGAPGPATPGGQGL